MGLSIQKLSATHDVAGFDCGRPALNSYLTRYALANQAMNGAQTYVAMDEDRGVVGYYSLAVGQVQHAGAPDRLIKGLARHPVPVMILARLAVDQAWQGKRLGQGLLRDALLRTLQASDIAGLRAIVVHAKDEGARRFYQHFGFTPWADNPLQLFLLVKDARGHLAP